MNTTTSARWRRMTIGISLMFCLSVLAQPALETAWAEGEPLEATPVVSVSESEEPGANTATEPEAEEQFELPIETVNEPDPNLEAETDNATDEITKVTEDVELETESLEFENDLGFELAAVVPLTNTANCTQQFPTPPDDTVAVGGAPVRFFCVNNGGSGNAVNGQFRVTPVTSGWEWAYAISTSATTPTSAWFSIQQQIGPGGGISDGVMIFLRPTSSVPPAPALHQGDVTFRFIQTNGSDFPTPRFATLRANWASPPPVAPTAAEFNLTCDTDPLEDPDPVPALAGVGGIITVDCVWSALTTLSDREVTLKEIVAVAPAGWSIEIDEEFNDGEVVDQTLTASPNVLIKLTDIHRYEFSFRLIPGCAAVLEPEDVELTSTFVFNSADITGPETDFSIARDDAAGGLSVEITGGSMSWSHGYSFYAHPENAGTLTYNVSAASCAGWNVQISAGDFTYSGLYGGGPILSDPNFTLTSASDPAVTGVTVPSTSGSLGAGVKVLSATASNGVGTFSQTLGVNLAIPGGVLVGSYTSNVVVAVSSGP